MYCHIYLYSWEHIYIYLCIRPSPRSLSLWTIFFTIFVFLSISHPFVWILRRVVQFWAVRIYSVLSFLFFLSFLPPFGRVPSTLSISFDFRFRAARNSAQIFVNCVEMKSRETCRERIRISHHQLRRLVLGLIETLDWQRGNRRCFPRENESVSNSHSNSKIPGNTGAGDSQMIAILKMFLSSNDGRVETAKRNGILIYLDTISRNN